MCLACLLAYSTYLLALLRSYRRTSLREVEARQQLATDTHRHENQKLLAEILTASISSSSSSSNRRSGWPSRRT